MNFIINEDNDTIMIRMKWKYAWNRHTSSTPPWTEEEKAEFHHSCDMLIWRTWGRAYNLRCVGTSDFARDNVSTVWDVNFDVQRVYQNPHWNATVTKLPARSAAQPTSFMNWGTRRIQLDTKDNQLRRRVRNGVTYHQYPVVHEFGHAAGNSIYSSPGMHGDEYNSSSPFFSDRNSVMNVGRQFRNRHLDYVISQLNTMIPNTTFRHD